MRSAICTLFEGHYHLGAAALINSLHAHGYRGRVICGLRGPLPPWAEPSREAGPGVRVRDLGDGLEIWFVTIETKIHFTKYKPAFMLEMWSKGPAAGAENFYYFDPDIVLKCRWSFFEEWTGYGVALVEDVNSPMPEHHPRRAAWKLCLAKRNRPVLRQTHFYVNGGFCGISRSHQSFLNDWLDAMTLVGEHVGGLDQSMFSFAQGKPDLQSSAYPFSKTDQDALNIAVMTSSVPVSMMGGEGMDFRPGGWTMSHALGPDKPWVKNYLRDALRGAPPSITDREFWQYADGPVAFLPKNVVRGRRRALRLAIALSRFFRRA